MQAISKNKINKFRSQLKTENIDFALFLCSEPIHDISIQYFTGFRQARYQAFSLLLISEDKMTLMTSSLEFEQAEKEAKVDELIEIKENSIRRLLEERIKKNSKVGINGNLIPYNFQRVLQKNKLIDVSNIVAELRVIKEPKEIELIKKSCSISNQGIKIIMETLSEKITERELAAILEQELKIKGSEDTPFRTIVTSGSGSSMIHPFPGSTGRKIKEGLGLVDFGVMYKGYCSDVTVPFSIGNLSESQKRIEETVMQAYLEILKSVKAGMPAWELHNKANGIIESRGFKLNHSLGHGIGLEVHELPKISPKPTEKVKPKNWKETKLEENMVISIEPGVYVPGIGGCRIENNFLITKKGAKKLTNSEFISIP